MEGSVFMDKSEIPSADNLQRALGDKHKLWIDIRDRVFEKYPKGLEEWNFPGKKYGWSFRIKDKKRAIIYFLPREKSFLVAFVFGKRAFDAIMESDIGEQIKSDLSKAKVYAEGRGIRIPVTDSSSLQDIFSLIDTKLAF